MTAAQRNLNKLILPNKNMESFIPQEKAVLGEGWDVTAMGTPGWEFSLVCMTLLFSLGCLPHCWGMVV